MERVCFGTLQVLLYQAKGQNVRNDPLRDAVFSSFGSDTSVIRDGALSGHLKSGHDNVPDDVIEAARNNDPEDVAENFRNLVIPMINTGKKTALVLAIKHVLNDDQNILTGDSVGWLRGFTKEHVLSASYIDLAYLLASLYRFAILNVNNKDCTDGIAEIDDGYIDRYTGTDGGIHVDETDSILKWDAGEILRPVRRAVITDADIQQDVTDLKALLSKYPRPKNIKVPVIVDDDVELNYVNALYDAYGDAEGRGRLTRSEVDRNRTYKRDFSQQRKCFYAMETIRRSLQDAVLPIEYKEFDEMKDEVNDGIYPHYIKTYDNGFDKLTAVTGFAAGMPITRSLISLLPGWIGSAEKIGMCHMLANDQIITWKEPEDE